MLRKKLLTIALSGLLSMAIYMPAKAAGSISEIDQKIDTVQYETTDGLDDLGCNYQTADELIANLAQYEEESSELSVQSVDFDHGGTGIHASMPSKGNVHVLVIPVEFHDYKLDEDIGVQLESLFFGDTGENQAHYPYESLKGYYERASFQQLHLSGDIIPTISLPYDRKVYTDTTSGRELYSDVADAYKAYLLKDYTGTDRKGYLKECLSRYDSNQDGEIDGVYLYYAGGVEDSKSLWWSSVRKNSLMRDKEGELEISTSVCMLGHDVEERNVVCHETGHMLGLGDDYGYSSTSKGSYSNEMMNNNNADLTVFAKMLLGWVNPSDVRIIKGTPQEIELENVEKKGQCAIVVPKYNEKQGLYTKFFLLDYMTLTENNTSEVIPDEEEIGIQVYYIDATLNETKNGFLHDNHAEACAVCPLIQQIHADAQSLHGTYQQTMTVNSFIVPMRPISLGETHCNFRDGDELTPYTRPSSKYITSGSDVYSGMVLKDIQLKDGKASFVTGIETEKQQTSFSWKVESSNRDTVESLEKLNVYLSFSSDTVMAKNDGTGAYLEDDTGKNLTNVDAAFGVFIESGEFRLSASTRNIVQANKNYTIVIPKGMLADSCGNEVEEIRVPYSTNSQYMVDEILNVENVHYGSSGGIFVDENLNGIYIDGDYTPENKEDYKTYMYTIKGGALGSKIALNIPYIKHVGPIWKMDDNTWGVMDISDSGKIIIYTVNAFGNIEEKQEIANSNGGAISHTMAYCRKGRDIWLFDGKVKKKFSLNADADINKVMYIDDSMIVVDLIGKEGVYVFDHDGEKLYTVPCDMLISDFVKVGNRYLVLGENKLQIYNADFDLIETIDLNAVVYAGKICVLENGYIISSLTNNSSLYFYDKHFNKVEEIDNLSEVKDICSIHNNMMYMTRWNKIISLNYSRVNLANKTEHESKVYDYVEKEATCSEVGTKCVVEQCVLCGEEISRKEVEIPKTEHDIIVDEAVAATCTEDGLTEGSHCAVCGEVIVEQEVIKAVGHKEVKDEAVAATCTEDGLTEGSHCAVCGEVIVEQEVIKAVGHKEVKDEAVAATCTEDGLTEGSHCSVCGKNVKKGEIIPAKGHTAGEWQVIKVATTTEEGLLIKKCTVCKTVLATEPIEKLPAPTPDPKPTPEVTKDVTVRYTTHVQTFGWQGDENNADKWFVNGRMAGTSGKAKRLEGIKIRVYGNDNLGIQYTTHCQSYGWLPWSANGEMNGTEGEAKRLEAIKIQLTGADKDKYDVYYRVHAQSYGWLGWAKNGAPSGTAGYAKRLEGIQVVVVKKGAAAPGLNYAGVNAASGVHQTASYVAKAGSSPVVGNQATSNTNPSVAGEANVNVAYRTHVQTFGWQGWKYNGQMSGTSGQAKRLEGINIKLTNKPYSGSIVYTTHVQTYGWQGNENNPNTWKRDGDMSGTSGEAKRLEAIRIALTGEMAEHYDVYYRVHAQSFGWLGWAKNGEAAGTAGLAKRLEGIQIVLVPKNGKAPATRYQGITSVRTQAYIKK